MKDSLAGAHGEIERLKTELLRLEVEAQRSAQDYEMKKVELQRDFMELSNKKANQSFA